MKTKKTFSEGLSSYLRDILGIVVEEFDNGFRAADLFVSAATLAIERNWAFTPLINKRPTVKKWPLLASSNISDLLGWRLASVQRGVACDFGVVTGIQRGTWVTDFDGAQALETLRKLEARYGVLPPTPRVNTGSGGFHLYFKANLDGQDLRTVSKVFGEALDIRGWHGQSVVAGTKRNSGGQYEWAPGLAPDEVELSSLPQAWFDALPKHIVRPVTAVGPRQPRPSFSTRDNAFRGGHTNGSTILGDGPGCGGFHAPINSLCIRYFQTRGDDAPAEPLIAWICEKVEAAPKGPGRDVSRYLSTDYLADAAEGARNFVRNK